jgi:hypothetical protein
MTRGDLMGLLWGHALTPAELHLLFSQLFPSPFDGFLRQKLVW